MYQTIIRHSDVHTVVVLTDCETESQVQNIATILVYYNPTVKVSNPINSKIKYCNKWINKARVQMEMDLYLRLKKKSFWLNTRNILMPVNIRLDLSPIDQSSADRASCVYYSKLIT